MPKGLRTKLRETKELGGSCCTGGLISQQHSRRRKAGRPQMEWCQARYPGRRGPPVKLPVGGHPDSL
jgi:hypothetical protein